MYTLREHRKEMVLTGATIVAMVVFFLACLLLPWLAIEAVSPWLALPLAVVAAVAWGRWGLWATGGPAAVVSRVVIFGASALVVLVAALRILGWGPA